MDFADPKSRNTTLALAAAACERLRIADYCGSLAALGLDGAPEQRLDARARSRPAWANLDKLDEAIKLYITRLIGGSLNEREDRRALKIISFTIKLEHVALASLFQSPRTCAAHKPRPHAPAIVVSQPDNDACGEGLLVQAHVDAQANEINVFIFDLTPGGCANRWSVNEGGTFEDVKVFNLGRQARKEGILQATTNNDARLC